MKCIGINLSNEAKTWKIKTYKMLLKNYRKQVNGKTFHICRMKNLLLVACDYHSQWTEDSHNIYHNLHNISSRNRKIHPKVYI